jgi:nucleotide-binding universal stress UspA family protein
MITEQLIWFIDGRYFYKNITLDKVIHLANTHKMRVKIIIDAKVKSTQRWYWHAMVGDSPTANEDLVAINKKKKTLLKALEMSAIKAEIIVSESADHIKTINTELAKTNNGLLILEDTPPKTRHPIFQTLSEINAPVLLLTDKVWKEKINAIGAVDPLHENDRPAKIDEHIVQHLKSWENSLSVKWKLIHCCYISSVLYQYKNKVLSMHQDGLKEFADQFRIKNDQYKLLEGLPEEALKSYINKNHIDILFIGLVNRNMLDKFWVGSTTSNFLYEPPCDLLLIKQ